MAEMHAIAELLTAGAEPSPAEARDLARVGEFTASMYARLLHGVDAPPVDAAGSRAGRMAGSLTDRLSGSTGTRWAEGMGLGGSLLGDWWSGFWDTGAGRVGYEGLQPAAMGTLDLFDDEPATPRATSPRRPPGRARGSLFGPGPRASRASGRPPAGSAREMLHLHSGASMSSAALDALESGGLYLDDQIASAGTPGGAGPTSAAPGRTPAGPVGPSRRRATSHRALAMGEAGGSRAFSLDGVVVDSRTPALAGALGWADAAFGERGGRHHTGLAINGPAIQRLAHGAPLASRAATRTVHGLYDSVEGEFVSLADDQGAPTGEAAPGQVAVGRHGRSATSPIPGATHAGPSDAAAGQAALRPGPTATSLSSLVPASTTATPRVQAWSGGVFSAATGTQGAGAGEVVQASAAAGTSGGPWVAPRVTYDTAGRPRAQVSRGGISAPRVAMSRWTGSIQRVEGAEGAAAARSISADQGAGVLRPGGWRLAADMGPDLPLGASLSRHEMTAGRIAARRGPGAGAETFRPVLAGPASAPASREEAALDGVAWVALPSDEGAARPDVPLAAVPSGRRATMFPASTALALATPTPGRLERVQALERPEQALGDRFAAADRGALAFEPPGAPRSLVTDHPLASAGVATGLPTPEGRFGPGGAGRTKPSLVGGVWRPGPATPAAGYQALAGDARDVRQLLLPAVADTAQADVGVETTAYRQPTADAFMPAGARTARAVGGGSSRRAEPGPAGDVQQRWRADARAARRALRRPVMTAREALEAGPLLGSGGPLAEADRRGAARSAAPGLSREVLQRREHAAGRTAGAGAFQPGAISASLARSSGPELERVTRVLRSAGWTQAELAMLHLTPAPAEASVAHEGAAGITEASAAGRAAGGVGLGAATAGTGGRDAVQMVRNLARVLTGTEALAPGGRGEAGEAQGAGLGAEALLGGSRPLVGASAADRYFRGMAPERSRTLELGGLRDAVGELVAMAQASASAETAVQESARSGLVDRLERARRDLAPGASPNVLLRAASEAGPLPTSARVSAASGVPGELPMAVPPESAAAGGATPGYGRMGLDDRTLVSPSELHGDAGIAGRLESALAESARGPAGLTRLTGRAAPGGIQRMAAGEAASGADGDAVARVGVRAAAGSTGLGAVLAPEMMIAGMRGAGRRQTASGRGALPGEVAGLVGSEGASTGEVARGGERPPSGRRGAGTRGAARVVQLLERAGIGGREAQDAMVRTMVRSLEGGDRLVASHGALGDLTRSWLGRVDGNRTGLDLDMGDVRGDFQRVLASLGGGGRRRSSLAAESPILDAGVVQQPSARGDGGRTSADRSGLRRAVREAGRPDAGGGHGRRRAAQQAVQQTNWRFVETGSSAGTSHADLGRLAETVLDAPSAGERVPLPLVAPAVKAVAQTAMRKSRTEPRSGSSSRDVRPGEPPPGAEAAAPEAELSKEAFESLALEMADRIARRMKRDKERRGIWR